MRFYANRLIEPQQPLAAANRPRRSSSPPNSLRIQVGERGRQPVEPQILQLFSIFISNFSHFYSLHLLTNTPHAEKHVGCFKSTLKKHFQFRFHSCLTRSEE